MAVERDLAEAELRGRMLQTLEGLAGLPDAVAALQDRATRLESAMEGLRASWKPAGIPWWSLLLAVVLGAAIGFGVGTFHKILESTPVEMGLRGGGQP